MTVAPLVLPYFQAYDVNGAQLPGAKLYSYLAETSTPASTYSDPDGLALNTNPVVTDAAGRAFVYIPVGIAYKFDLFDADNVHQDASRWPLDNVILPDPTVLASNLLWPSTMLPWTTTFTFNAAAFSGTGIIPAAGYFPANVFIIALKLTCLQNFSTANGLVTLGLSDGTNIKASGLGILTSTVYTMIPWLTPMYPTATQLQVIAEGGSFGPTGQLKVDGFGIQFP